MHDILAHYACCISAPELFICTIRFKSADTQEFFISANYAFISTSMMSCGTYVNTYHRFCKKYSLFLCWNKKLGATYEQRAVYRHVPL